MKEIEFQSNLRAAKLFHTLSHNPNEQEFWEGYQYGLRRHYHGENFGTAQEHQLWMSLADDSDKSRADKMRGLGYRAGFERQNIQQAMKTLSQTVAC